MEPPKVTNNNQKMKFLVAVLFALLSFVTAGTIAAGVMSNATTTGSCGGNCPGGCSSCPCGETKAAADIATWCAKYSWNQANCKCIVSHESGGNSHAVNQNSGGSYDVGMWQVNDYNWASCSGGKAPCDLTSNLNCAIKVYQWGGNTWKFWSTCGVCGACSSH